MSLCRTDKQTTEDRATQPMEAGGGVPQKLQILKMKSIWSKKGILLSAKVTSLGLVCPAARRASTCCWHIFRLEFTCRDFQSISRPLTSTDKDTNRICYFGLFWPQQTHCTTFLTPLIMRLEFIKMTTWLSFGWTRKISDKICNKKGTNRIEEPAEIKNKRNWTE